MRPGLIFARTMPPADRAQAPKSDRSDTTSAAMSTDRTIDYIEFPAADLDAAKRFYAEVFGWKFEDYGPEYCAFSDGRLDGGFYKAALSSSTSAGSALVVLYAVDLDETLARVTRHGGTIVKPIFSFPGGRRFHFADPNGNELAVWSQP